MIALRTQCCTIRPSAKYFSERLIADLRAVEEAASLGKQNQNLHLQEFEGCFKIQ